ncbi:YqzE family protein [Bacillus sp. 2205SS5-2]|uniref:YqzE family protein n=1 Tax=Bacillus sp. 2205SS5-2 TaxID=3109031 RepID=UPI003006C6A8
MSVNDYVKFVTQNLVQHFDKPKAERKSLRKKRKQQKASFLFRWFGVIPYILMGVFKRK